MYLKSHYQCPPSTLHGLLQVVLAIAQHINCIYLVWCNDFCGLHFAEGRWQEKNHHWPSQNPGPTIYRTASTMNYRFQSQILHLPLPYVQGLGSVSGPFFLLPSSEQWIPQESLQHYTCSQGTSCTILYTCILTLSANINKYSLLTTEMEKRISWMYCWSSWKLSQNLA